MNNKTVTEKDKNETNIRTEFEEMQHRALHEGTRYVIEKSYTTFKIFW